MYRHMSHAIHASEDDPQIRRQYRPWVDDESCASDWVDSLELSTVLKMVDYQVLKSGGDRLKVLVLYGSMRQR